MSTLPTHLCRVEAIVSNVADGTYSHAQGLAQLRTRGFSPWPQGLADAVRLIQSDRLEAETDLIWILEQLAKKPAEMALS